MDIYSFNAMASRLRPRLRTAARRWLSDAPRGCDEADDVVQDTLLRLWTLRDRLDGYDNPDAVAMVTARRLAIDAIRRTGCRPAESLAEDVARESTDLAPDEALDSEMCETLASKLLARLPDRQAMIVKMRHSDGLEPSEIAALTGMTEGNVRTLLSRGRQRLRELYLSTPA